MGGFPKQRQSFQLVFQAVVAPFRPDRHVANQFQIRAIEGDGQAVTGSGVEKFGGTQFRFFRVAAFVFIRGRPDRNCGQ